MTTQDKVFDILELATLIADELTQHDLALCCLVNFHCYNTFTPHLWHSITFRNHDPVTKFLSPSGCAGLIRNGHHIRVLRSSDLEILDPFVKSGSTCTNLVCLDTDRKAGSHMGTPRGTSIGVRSAASIATGRRGYVGEG